MIVLLRLAIIAITAVLSACGLALVVVSLLAAQWLVVAGLMLLLMAIVGGARGFVKRLTRSKAGTGSDD